MDEFRQQLKDISDGSTKASDGQLEAMTTFAQLCLRNVDAATVEAATQLELCRQLERAAAEARRADADRRRAEDKLVNAEEHLEDIEEELGSYRRLKESAVEQLTAHTAKYHAASQRLRALMGIQIRKVSSKVTGAAPVHDGEVVRIITLTRVDETDPGREYHCQYAQKADRIRFLVTKPQIDGLADIQREFDASSDPNRLFFSICALRERFQALAEQRAARQQRRAARRAARNAQLQNADTASATNA